MKKILLLFSLVFLSQSALAQTTNPTARFRCELKGAGTIQSVAESSMLEFVCIDAGEVPDPVCKWEYVYKLPATAKTPASPRLSLQYNDAQWTKRRVGIKVSKAVTDFLATRPTLKRAVVPGLEPYYEVSESAGIKRPVAVLVVSGNKLLVQEATLTCTVGQ